MHHYYYLKAVQKYLEYTGDYRFVKEELYETMQGIIENYCKGINVDGNNIYLDKDGLIVSGNRRYTKHMDGCKI